MGGNKQKKSSFFSFFKAKKGRKEQDSYPAVDDDWSTRKVYIGDEDSTRSVVAEPVIDNKTSAFIANFQATRVSEASLLPRHSTNYWPHTRQPENEAAVI